MNLKNRESYHIDCFESVETEIKGIYDVSFLPKEPGYYKCMLLFNNKHIKGKLKEYRFKENLFGIVSSILNLIVYRGLCF
jgi:hypothetical protein